MFFYFDFALGRVLKIRVSVCKSILVLLELRYLSLKQRIGFVHLSVHSLFCLKSSLNAESSRYILWNTCHKYFPLSVKLKCCGEKGDGRASFQNCNS